MESYLSQSKRGVQILLDDNKDNNDDLFGDNDLQKSLFSMILCSHWDLKHVVTQ